MSDKILVETSARHVHVTEEQIAILFGEGASLTPKKDLSQPGQFACEERVTVVGPKKSIPNVIILGPARSAAQVEVSLTDARSLGVTAPVARAATLPAPLPASSSDPAERSSLPKALSPQNVTYTSIPQPPKRSDLRTSRS